VFPQPKWHEYLKSLPIKALSRQTSNNNNIHMKNGIQNVPKLLACKTLTSSALKNTNHEANEECACMIAAKHLKVITLKYRHSGTMRKADVQFERSS